jgi:hypothetical protein
MARPTNTFSTYEAIGNREDLSNVIYNISPTDTPFFSMIAKTKASARSHEWQTDSLAQPATTTRVEGDDESLVQLDPTVRLNNICAIIRRDFVVSGTQEVVDKAGRKSEVGYQLAKKIKEIKNSTEAILTANTARAAGDATNPRIMAGLGSWVKTNNNLGTGSAAAPVTIGSTARTDGTQRAFTEDAFKDVLQKCYVAGGNPDTVMLGPKNKQRFSMFSGGATRFDRAEDAKLVATVDVYRSDFGTLKILPNRFQRERDGWVLDTEYWALAVLRPLRTADLAKTGDSMKKMVLHECTLVARNEAASGLVADLNA